MSLDVRLTAYRAAERSLFTAGLNQYSYEEKTLARTSRTVTIGAYVSMLGRCLSLTWAKP